MGLKLPATAAEAQNAAVTLRDKAIAEYTRRVMAGRDKNMAFMLLTSRLDEIDENLSKPRELPEADKIF